MVMQLMMPATAARRLGVSARYVQQLADTGRLPVAGRTVEGVRLFRPADVERFATAREARRASPPVGSV